jgi:hypothetical protein
VLTAVVLMLAAAAVTVALSRRGAGPAAGPAGPAAGGGQDLAAESAARSQAVAWITSQVSRNAVVACDPVMCSALAGRGFPSGDLNVLQSTAPDPLGSDILMATADIRSQFGSKLAGVYAPEVIASFGRGTARIDIRAMATDGAAAYRTALSADLLARKAYGAALLRNHRIAVSAAARRQLAAGRVDSRLLSLLDFLAAQQPVDIVGFGGIAPGAASAVPLRFADLAQADTAAGKGGSKYVQSLLAALGQEVTPFHPMTTAMVRLPGGQAVLRVEFGAPSPLGLLKPPRQ